jgi:Flp pilus assembly protein TadG
MHPARSSQPRPARLGTAAVELAICAPLLFLLVMGTIETANYIHLKQALTLTSYETAVSVTALGGTETAARQNGTDILTAHGVKGATVSFSPTVTTNTPAGTRVQVTTQAPVAANAVSPPWFFRSASIRVTTSMVKL